MIKPHKPKPHFRFKGGVWSCVTFESWMPFCDRMRAGYGYTVREAWDEWRAQW